MTTFDTDPNTQTVAAAWASSSLGQPEREVRYGFAPEPIADADDSLPVADAVHTRRPVAKHAIIAAALACGIAGGAALGLMLFEFDPAQSTVVVPGVGTSPQPNVVLIETSEAPSPKPAVPVQETAPRRTTAPAPASKASTPDVSTPPPAPQGDTVVVDIPIPDYPPLPEKPDQQDPEPPKPEDPDPEPPKPPVPPDLDFKLPEPPKPEPDPEPPVFVPDLPLAPSPKLNPQPEPPSLPKFVLPAELGS